MADATSTQISIQDIPEYLRDYRKGILNAAVGLTFNPNTDWFHANFPNANYQSGTYSPPPSGVDPNGGITGQSARTPQTGQAPNPGIQSLVNPSYTPPPDPSYQAAYHPSIPGFTWDTARGEYVRAQNMAGGGALRYVSGGGTQLDQAYDAILQSVDPSGIHARNTAEGPNNGVTLGPGGTPLGGIYNPIQTGGWNIPYNIGTNTVPINGPTGAPPPAGGGLTPPQFSYSPGYGLNPPPGGSAPPPTGAPPTGTPPPSGGTPPSGQQPAPNNVVPHTNLFGIDGPAGTSSSAQISQLGYNPNQYSTDARAQQLAGVLGAGVQHNQNAGPNAPPPQNLLNFGGSAQLNSGLIDTFLGNGGHQDPGQTSFELSGLRNEILRNGGDTSTIDKLIADSTAAYQASLNQPGTASAAGVPVIHHADGGETMASFHIGHDGRVRNYKRGGAVRLATGQTGTPGGGFSAANPFLENTVQQQAPSGGEPNVFGAGSSNTNVPNGTSPTSNDSIFNPYVPYQNQRTLAYSPDFGQTGPNGVLQASNLTQGALAGIGALPNYYNSNGTINYGGTDLGQGVSNLYNSNQIGASNAGLANQFAQNTLNNPNSTSTFQNTLQYISQNPQAFQAGDINIPTLTAPQLNQPNSVQAQSAADVQGQAGTLTPYQTAYAPQLNQYQQAPAQQVDSQNVGTGSFNSRQAARYISPYIGNVLNQQTNLAQQQYNEQQGQRNAQAVSAGAYGGSREAVANSLSQRDLNQQLQLMQAQGLQSAYTNAQGQFNTDQSRGLAAQQSNQGANLQSQLANQQAGVQIGSNNLNSLNNTQALGAGIGTQTALANLGALNTAAQTAYGTNAQIAQQAANQNLQAQLANQQAGITVGNYNLNSALQTQGLGVGAGLSAQQSNQSTRLAQNQALLNASATGDQLQQQAYQNNVNNSLASLGQANVTNTGYNQAAQAYTDSARLAQQLQLQGLQAQQQAGGQIDTQTQSALDLAYQDFINQRNNPYQQLNFLQGIQSGTPFGTTLEGFQFQRPSSGGLTGLATAGIGALSNTLSKSPGT